MTIAKGSNAIEIINPKYMRHNKTTNINGKIISLTIVNTLHPQTLNIFLPGVKQHSKLRNRAQKIMKIAPRIFARISIKGKIKSKI